MADFNNIDPNQQMSFQDQLAKLRSTLPQNIQANLPTIPGQPSTQPAPPPMPAVNKQPTFNEMMASTNPAAPVPSPTAAPTTPGAKRDELDQAIGAIPKPTIGQPGDPTLQQLKDDISKIPPKILQQLARQATAIEPPKLQGPDIISNISGGAPSRGGIFGTGIEPIDVLTFALGIGATWNLPQAQAQANTFEIASWPSKFKENQRKAGGEFVSQAVQGMNAISGASNAVTAQMKQQQELQQEAERERIAQAYDVVGRHADAAALRAGPQGVSNHIALNNQKLESTRPPTNIADLLSVMAETDPPFESIDPNILKYIGQPKTQEEFQQKVIAAANRLLLTRQPITTPGGEVILRSLSGPKLYNGPVPVGQQPQQVVPGQQAPARPNMPVPPTQGPQHIPPSAQAPQAQAAPQGTGALIQSASASQNPSDQWVARHAGLLPQNVVNQANRLFAKNLDSGDRQKMVAQLATYQYAQDLSQSFEDMVKSYGGDDKYKIGDRLKQAAMHIGGQLSDPNVFTLMFTKTLRQLAQDGKMTPEAIAFSNMYAQAQAFAKGSLNDAGNVALSERNMFGNMIGQVEDKPNVFRNNILIFQRQVARNYNTMLNANQLKRTDGFEPLPIPEYRFKVGEPKATPTINKEDWKSIPNG